MDKPVFKDLFSDASAEYAAFRPQYPPELFAHLAKVSVARDLAWDCATGNGQAAKYLASHFNQVIATDPSSQQLAEAVKLPNIEYRLETAERPSLENDSVDLITIAQALHWFDWEKFYPEVNRVLKENGIIATIAYGLPEITPAIDELIKHLHNIILRNYWEQERQLVADLYKDIPFPFRQMDTPDFFIVKEMDKAQLLGYLATWSGLKKYIVLENSNPLQVFADKLNEVWPEGEESILVTWRLACKVGKKYSHLIDR